MGLDEITYKIIGAAFAVHRTLGPGLLENIYEEALVLQLKEDGLKVVSQVEIPVIYKGTRLHTSYRLDLLIEDSVIVELKSVSALTDLHHKQLLTYLRLAKKPIGLLLNFNENDMKDGIVRISNGYVENR